MSKAKRSTGKTTEQRDAFGQTKAERESAIRGISRIIGTPVPEVRRQLNAKQAELLREKQQERKPVSVKFAWSASGGLYQVSPEATAGEVADRIFAQLDHVHGILLAIHGGGMEQFHEINEEGQNEILGGLYSMVQEARDLFGVFLERVSPTKGGDHE